MRRLAIRTLARIGTDASTRALTARFDDAPHGERIEILRACGNNPATRPQALLENVLLSATFDIADGPLLRSWAAWVAQEIGGTEAADLLERSVRRRQGLDGGVLIRLGVMRGAEVADFIDGYRRTRLRAPYWFRGAAQDRIDALVRDLRAGRGAERFRDPPRDDAQF